MLSDSGRIEGSHKHLWVSVALLFVFMAILGACSNVVRPMADAGSGAAQAPDASDARWSHDVVQPYRRRSYVELVQYALDREIVSWGRPRDSRMRAFFFVDHPEQDRYPSEQYQVGDCKFERWTRSLTVRAGTITIVTNGSLQGRVDPVEPELARLPWYYASYRDAWHTGDRVVVSATGDVVPPFSVELVFPPPTRVANLGELGEPLRVRIQGGLTIEWAETSAAYVWVHIDGGISVREEYVDEREVNCYFPTRLRRGVVPPSMLERLTDSRFVAVHTANLYLGQVGPFLLEVRAAQLIHVTGPVTFE